MKLFRNSILLTLVLMLALPGLVRAQETSTKEKPRPAKVLKVETRNVDGEDILVYTARFLTNPNKGTEVVIGDNETVTTTSAKTYRVGDKIFLSTIDHIDGSTRYIILDQDRRGAMLWLIIGFIVAVAWFSRWQGIRSILGLAFSLLVIVGWLVPQIAKGVAPVPITLLGATVVLVVGFLLTEGWSRLTAAALTGTVLTMSMIGLISVLAVRFTGLTGNASEETFFLNSSTGVAIDLRGLLLAGIIIGTLGILDDIAVSQAATVGELRRANPAYTGGQLYRSAMRVGRSHLVAIINTLTFAYAGSALPLLVLFSSGQASWMTVVNGELIATEIVRSIVGSLGLILALPISTLAAVVLGVRSTHVDHHHTHS